MSVRLIPFTQNAFPFLLKWIDSPRVLVQWTGPIQFKYPLDEDQLLRHFKTSVGETPDCYAFSVIDDAGEIVGHIELAMILREHGCASVCRVLVSPQERGKGYCLPMMQKILRYGFEELHLRRIDLRVYAHNKSAVQCYARAGFIQEGLNRKALRMGDEFWDTIHMAVLREEWEVHKGNE